DCIDVGWWEGELNGRRGVFPDNFVKLLPSDFEKEVSNTFFHFHLKIQNKRTTDRKHEIKKIPPERPECLPNRTEEKGMKCAFLPVLCREVREVEPMHVVISHSVSIIIVWMFVFHSDSLDSPKVELVGSTVSGTLEKDSSERSNDIDLEGFDSVIPIAEKLNHPTTTRPKATGRRPPSQSLTSSSLSSPDFFDSPSPEDEKEEHVSITHKTLEVSRKSRTVTISQVSDNKTSLPPKPGGLASGSNVQPSLSPSPSPGFHSIAMGTTGHRSNSPSLFGTEGKPKTEHLNQGQTALEELRTQIRELRTIIETMKDQQK
ncbi:SH3K1 protein, partial [Panurus biarmicus]|nr:SH3K1 protein [Panurus biarmicus]